MEKLGLPRGRITMLATVQTPRQPNLKMREVLPFHDHEKQIKGLCLEDPAAVAVEGVAAVVGLGGPLG